MEGNSLYAVKMRLQVKPDNKHLIEEKATKTAPAE